MTLPHSPIIHSLFIGQPKTITDERGTWHSSIFRDPVYEPVMAQKGGLVGDKVFQPYHGGPDADICVYLLDHYRFWHEQYGMTLAPGYVGENFTLDGVTEEEICAGDIVWVGQALAQVTGPRIPCANLARRIGRPDWVKLMLRENRTGFYMAVLEPGRVQPGDAWQLAERFSPDGSIPALNHFFFHQFDPVFGQRITQMQGLAAWWQEQAREKGQKLGHHWTDSYE